MIDKTEITEMKDVHSYKTQSPYLQLIFKKKNYSNVFKHVIFSILIYEMYVMADTLSKFQEHQDNIVKKCETNTPLV